jgi:hypothetical protein
LVQTIPSVAEQVEETKITRYHLRFETFMVKTYKFNGCTDGQRSVHNKEFICLVDTPLQKTLQAPVLFYLDCRLVVWSSAS